MVLKQVTNMLTDGESTENKENGNSKSATPQEDSDDEGLKLTSGVIEACLTDFLDGQNIGLSYRERKSLNVKFKVYVKDENSEPAYLIFNNHNQTVKPCNYKYVAATLRRDIRRWGSKGFYGQLNVDFDQCKKIARAWGWTADEDNTITDWPWAVGFKSDPGIFLTRHDFDPIPMQFESFDNAYQMLLKDECPIFYETLGRMTNSEAFCLRIGSLFDPNADRKQAIWLYGPKDAGKSFINDLMALIVGKQGVVDISPGFLRSSHWKQFLIGKTVMVVREAPVSFIETDEFLSITGEKSHTINPKNEPAYQAELNCFIFMASNNAPTPPDQDEFKERLIVCHLDKVPDGKEIEYHLLMDLVKAELPFFISFCKRLYDKYGKKRLPTDKQSQALLDAAIEDNEMVIASVINNYFIKAEGAEEVTPTVLNMTLERHMKSNKLLTLPKIRKFLRKHYESEFTKDGRGNRVITNIKLRPEPIVDPNPKRRDY